MERFPGMAYIAMYFDVFILKGEFCFVVIEDGAFPVLIVMAFIAKFSVTTVVEIIGLVAVIAIGYLYITDLFYLIVLKSRFFPILCVMAFIT